MNNRELGAVGFYSGPEDIPKLPSALIHKGQSQSATRVLPEFRTTHGSHCDYVVYRAERSEHGGQALGVHCFPSFPSLW